MVVNHRIMFINHDPFFKPLKRIARGFILKYIKHMCTHHQATPAIFRARNPKVGSHRAAVCIHILFSLKITSQVQIKPATFKPVKTETCIRLKSSQISGQELFSIFGATKQNRFSYLAVQIQDHQRIT